jgi:hypothetical protein
MQVDTDIQQVDADLDDRTRTMRMTRDHIQTRCVNTHVTGKCDAEKEAPCIQAGRPRHEDPAVAREEQAGAGDLHDAEPFQAAGRPTRRRRRV